LGQRGDIHERPPRQPGLAAVQPGGGQQLLQQPLQLLALPARHAQQLLLLEDRQRLAALLQGRQRAKQRRQRPPQLVGDHGQQLLGPLARLLAASRLVGHREPQLSSYAPPGGTPHLRAALTRWT
jgi:hypothetical protein